MHQLSQLSRKELLAGFKEQGVELTPEQWSILLELWKEDGLSPSQLADLTGRDRPSVSRLIESLKKQGLIKRMYSEEDRRAYCVYLTTEGKRCHKTLLPIHHQQLEKAITGLDTGELETCNAVLKQIYKNLKQEP